MTGIRVPEEETQKPMDQKRTAEVISRRGKMPRDHHAHAAMNCPLTCRNDLPSDRSGDRIRSRRKRNDAMESGEIASEVKQSAVELQSSNMQIASAAANANADAVVVYGSYDESIYQHFEEEQNLKSVKTGDVKNASEESTKFSVMNSHRNEDVGEEIDQNMVINATWSDLIPGDCHAKEREFYVNLFSWMERERPELLPSKLPNLGFHPVDFYSMYHMVTKYGGYELFNGTHGWSLVHRKMKNYRPTMTSASYRIKKYYGDFLLDYEKAHYTPPLEAPELREEDMEIPIKATVHTDVTKNPPGRPPRVRKKRKASTVKKRKHSADMIFKRQPRRIHRPPSCLQTIEINFYLRDPGIFGHGEPNLVGGPLYGDLFYMSTGKALTRLLPVKARATTFGKLFYFELPDSLLPEDKDTGNLDTEQLDLINEQRTFAKNTLKKGEIAFWADQNTFICGYGATPVSRYQEEVRLIDYCVSCGRLWDFSLDDLEKLDIRHDLWVTVVPTSMTRIEILKKLGREHLISHQRPIISVDEQLDHSIPDSDGTEDDDMYEVAELLVRFEHEPVVKPKCDLGKMDDQLRRKQEYVCISFSEEQFAPNYFRPP